MVQLAVVLVSFLVIPALTKAGVKAGPALIAAALTAALLNGLSLTETAGIFINIFLKPSSSQTLLVVIMVGILGTIMKEYGILDSLVSALSDLISNKRILFMLIPAVFGVLTIPGGALLSAPFIGDLGESTGMTPRRQAAVNLVFRHMATFIMPYSTSMLVVKATFPQLNIYRLISLNVIFTIGMVVVGYFLYLRDIPVEKKPASANVKTSLKAVLIYSSPIYACVLVNMITGIPLYITMFLSLAILYFLGPKKSFLKLVLTSVSFGMTITIIGVFFIQGVVESLPQLKGLFTAMFEGGTYAVLAIVLGSLFFGLITGMQMSPMSIILPMLASLNMAENRLLPYIYLTCCWCFLGYFFSPLHMCQLFTCQNLNVKIGQLWKEYLPFAPSMVFLLTASFFIMEAVLY